MAHGEVPTDATSESVWSACSRVFACQHLYVEIWGKCCLRFIKMMNAFPTLSLRKWRKSSTTPESTHFSTSQCSPPPTACSWTWRESTAWPTSKELWIFSRRSKPVSTLENNHFSLPSWGVWQQGTYAALQLRCAAKGESPEALRASSFLGALMWFLLSPPCVHKVLCWFE